MKTPPRVPPRPVVQAALAVRGALERVVTKMAPPEIGLLELVTDRWRPEAIGVVARLGVADLLAGGPRDVGALARELSVDEGGLYRVLRALSRDGIFEETSPRTFALSPLAEPLRADHPRSVRNTVLQVTSDVNRRTWSRLGDSVRTGEPMFADEHGCEMWTYLESHDDDAKRFHGSMRELTVLEAPLLARAYDFGRHARIVDLGGGSGELIAEILATYPRVEAAILDSAVAMREAPEVMAAKGVEARVTTTPGDFMQAIPDGYDAYILKQIVHGFSDDDLTKLFQKLRAAMSPRSKLLAIEILVPPPKLGRIHPSYLDLQMLVGAGGRQRTREEFDALYRRNGFRLDDVIETVGATSIVVGSPA